jgi:hypothetical protein
LTANSRLLFDQKGKLSRTTHSVHTQKQPQPELPTPRTPLHSLPPHHSCALPSRFHLFTASPDDGVTRETTQIAEIPSPAHRPDSALFPTTSQARARRTHPLDHNNPLYWRTGRSPRPSGRSERRRTKANGRGVDFSSIVAIVAPFYLDEPVPLFASLARSEHPALRRSGCQDSATDD